MEITPEVLVFGIVIVGLLLYVLWNAISMLVIAIKYRRNPDLLPPKPVTMANDPDYHPTKWVFTIPDDPDEANERLKWAARKTFAGLQTLANECEFTPEEARDLELSFDHLRLLQTLVRLYSINIDHPQVDAETRMMALVGEALDEQPRVPAIVHETPDDLIADFESMNVAMANLGTLYFIVSRNLFHEGYDISKLDPSEIQEAICFVWNFLTEWSQALRGGDDYRDLQASDFVDFDLTDEQVDALLEMVKVVEKVDAPICANGDDDQEYDDDGL